MKRCNEPTHIYLDMPGAMRLCPTHLGSLEYHQFPWGVTSVTKPCDQLILEPCCDATCARARAEVQAWDRPHTDATTCAGCGALLECHDAT